MIVQTEITSNIRTRYQLISRDEFKDAEGVFPEDCRLMQVEGEDGLLKDFKGIAVKYDDDRSKPELVINHTKRVIVNKEVLAAPSASYGNQANRMWRHQAEIAAKTLGMSSGDAYKTKKKPTKIYSRDEVRKAMNTYLGRKGLLPQEAKREARTPTAGGPSPCAVPGTPMARRPHSPALSSTSGSRLAIGDQEQPVVAVSVAPGQLALADGSVGELVPVASSVNAVEWTATAAASDEQATRAEEAEKSEDVFVAPDLTRWDVMKVKPPQYWLAKLYTEEMVWHLGGPPRGDLNFAKACVSRCLEAKDTKTSMEVVCLLFHWDQNKIIFFVFDPPGPPPEPRKVP